MNTNMEGDSQMEQTSHSPSQQKTNIDASSDTPFENAVGVYAEHSYSLTSLEAGTCSSGNQAKTADTNSTSIEVDSSEIQNSELSSFGNSTADLNAGIQPVSTSTPIDLIASFDGGWQKRGSGRSYDSLSGHSSLIGYHSGKILGYATRVKRCAKCKAGQSPESHDCRKNFSGSAKSMEADMAVELIAKNPDLEKQNARIGTMIADDDSSTLSHLRRECAHPVTKWSDTNHASKNLTKAMHQVKPKISQAVIDYYSYNFGVALKTNKGNAEAVEASLRAMVPHSFDDHSKCGTWCDYLKDPVKYKHKHLPGNEGLTGDALRAQLENILLDYINNAEKLAPCGSSQVNESFNRTVSSKAPKSIHYSSSESLDFRVAVGVCDRNIGKERTIVEVNEKKGLSPGSFTKKYRRRLDEKRRREVFRSRTVTFKRRRLTGKKIRAQRRALLESAEGLTYQSGMDMAAVPSEDDIDDPVPLPSLSDDTKVIVFDLETTGHGKSAEVVQIAAKYKDQEFNQYILPSKGFTKEASQVTGLNLTKGELTLHGVVVCALPPRQAYANFMEFLRSISSSVVLLAHNGFTFDARVLTREIILFGMWGLFKSIVTGFADTLPLFKKKLPDRVKSKETFRQEGLAEDLLPLAIVQSLNAHNAISDVQILAALIEKVELTDSDVIESAKPVNL